MRLPAVKRDTFRRHAQCFVEPAVVHKWKKDQRVLLQQLQGGKVAACGGMQSDSPGHSAKFGSYSLMHMESNTIIDLQLVQSNEVGGSYHMEKEGLKRSLDLLEDTGLDVDYIVTERHPQIQKYLRERKVTHYYNVWHFEKGSMVVSKVYKRLRNKRLLKDVGKLSNSQTSSLEAFHSLSLRFAPKNVVFPFIGLLCRLYLAIMHCNENAGRKQAETSSGQAAFKVKSRKGRWKSTSNYLDALLELVFNAVFQDPAPFVAELKAVPVPDPLADPLKRDAAARHASHFQSGGGQSPPCRHAGPGDPRRPRSPTHGGLTQSFCTQQPQHPRAKPP